MTGPAFAAVGLADRLLHGALTRLAAAVLPWSDRSQHDSYLAGYKDGLRERTRADRQESADA